MCSIAGCPPQLIDHPKSASVDIYTSVTFKCTAKLDGNIQTQWKKLNSVKLPQLSTTVTSFSHDVVTSILKIDKIIHHYKGYYYCVVKNEIGEVNSSMAELHVDGMFSILEVCISKLSLSLLGCYLIYSSLSRNNRSSS